MRRLLWFALVIVLIPMAFQEFILRGAKLCGQGIYQLETADTPSGQALIRAWHDLRYGDGTTLDVARNNTNLDFILIALYVILILLESYLQMQQEKRITWNLLLRLNLLLILIAGLLDFAEDLILLHNFRHVIDGRFYLPTYLLSYSKFLFLIWTVAVWLLSLVHSAMQRLTNLRPTLKPEP